MRFDGLAEFRAQLRQLPRELTDEAQEIVHDAAERAKAMAERGYPEVTGNLKKGLYVRVDKRVSASFGARAVLVNVAPHSHLYENGSAVRSFNGWNRGRMPQPPRHVFVPAAMRARREMYLRLRRLVEGKGFKVTGRADVL